MLICYVNYIYGETMKKLKYSSILLSAMLSTGAYAGDFSLGGSTTPQAQTSQSNSVADTKEIIATGYGISEEQALNNAFKTAIQQFVGVVVDAETQVKDSKLIKDDILTASNGYIQSYDILSKDTTDGLFTVEIKAIVKSQKVYEKIQSLNISTMKVTGGKNIQAEIQTKKQSKEEMKVIVDKAIDDFFATENIKSMLTVNVDNAKWEKDKEKDGKVPLVIDYSIAVNYDAYLKNVEKLEQTFENIGAKKISKIDLPSNEKSPYLKYTKDSFKAFAKESACYTPNTHKDCSKNFLIIKKYGNGYRTDVWQLPVNTNFSEYLNRYSDKLIELSKQTNLTLELKDKTTVIQASNVSIHAPNKEYDTLSLYPLVTSYSAYDSYYSYYNRYGIYGLAPFISFSKTIKANIETNTTIDVPVNDISKINQISLILE